MTGARAAWLVSVPVALAGCLAAHVAAYALVPPVEGAHAPHGYLGYLPVAGGAGLAVVLAAAVRHASRGRAGTRPSPCLFALLPPFAFTLQEHLERLAAPALLAGDATFLVGLALQLPFGLLSWLLARAILRAAEQLAALLAPPPRARVGALARLRPVDRTLAARPFAAGAPHRGPPAAVASRP